jgi:hypothetical protein
VWSVVAANHVDPPVGERGEQSPAVPCPNRRVDLRHATEGFACFCVEKQVVGCDLGGHFDEVTSPALDRAQAVGTRNMEDVNPGHGPKAHLADSIYRPDLGPDRT